jgi:hypothetical protein
LTKDNLPSAKFGKNPFEGTFILADMNKKNSLFFQSTPLFHTGFNHPPQTQLLFCLVSGSNYIAIANNCRITSLEMLKKSKKEVTFKPRNQTPTKSLNITNKTKIIRETSFLSSSTSLSSRNDPVSY